LRCQTACLYDGRRGKHKRSIDMNWNNRIINPFEELRMLQREMNRLFDDYDRNTSLSRFPALNIWGNSDQVVVSAELPGLEIEDLELDIVNNQLTIKGERKNDKPAGDDVICHRRERDAGNFVRTIRLPFAIENEKVSAQYVNGVLTVTLPRHEATKPKRIEIKAS